MKKHLALALLTCIVAAGCTAELPVSPERSATDTGQSAPISMAPLTVDFNVKPGGCDNPINFKSKGKTPVAILGSASLDVSDIDVSSVRLEGVEADRSSIEDVAAPDGGAGPCDCTETFPDAIDDLTLKFKTADLVAAIGDVDDRTVIILTITGQLLDGTTFEGQDCIVALKPGTGPSSVNL